MGWPSYDIFQAAKKQYARIRPAKPLGKLLHKQEGDCKRLAIIIDGGFNDKGNDKSSANSLMEDASSIQTWIESQKQPWVIHRIILSYDASMFVGPASGMNKVDMLKPVKGKSSKGKARMKNNLLGLIEGYAKLLKCPKHGRCCHQVFIYITAHGFKGGFSLYNVYHQYRHASIENVRYKELFKAFKKFSKCVKLTLFIDSCFSGSVMHVNETSGLRTKGRIDAFKDSHCGLHILTTSDNNHVAFSGATKQFVETKGGIREKYERMKDWISGEWKKKDATVHPYEFHWPDKTRWCSLDTTSRFPQPTPPISRPEKTDRQPR